MGPRTVVELVVAAGCITLGARWWLADASDAPALVVRAERSAADGRALAQPVAPDPADASAPTPPRPSDAASEPLLSPRAAPDAPGSTATEPLASPTDGAASSRAIPFAPLPPIAGPPAPRVPESLARVALRFVGKDAGAEATWRDAIDDLGMPEEARSDLIEDLNEEGYVDDDRPVAADLPLILARLRLIERLAPSAMDEVNAAAFAEVYKDLLAMLVRLRGEPERGR